MDLFFILILIAIGFINMANYPPLILLYCTLVVVTGLISYILYRRQKILSLSRMLMKGFLVLTCVLLAGSVIGVVTACVYLGGPFCIFGAAPFLSSALMTSCLALIAYVVSRQTGKKKEPEKIG